MPEQLLPQPPPDVPAPPMGKEAALSQNKMAGIVTIGIVCAVILFGLLTSPLVLKSHVNRELTAAMSNLRQVHLALFEFEVEYGRCPDASTAAEVKKKTGTSLTLGDGSSNELFVQLLAASPAPTEWVFESYSKGSSRPDNVFTSDATALAPGECGFAYIAGLSLADDPKCPIAFGPVIPGTRDLDTKVFDGKAIVLRLDGSVTAMNIHPSGEIRVYGMDILDPRQPYWNGRAPQVKWPR